MVKAAVDIPRPDGSVIKKGEVISDELVHEFESSSPQLLDCYITQNAKYFKKVGKKLIPHIEVMERDLVEVKTLKPKKKPSKKQIKENNKSTTPDKRKKSVDEMTKLQLDKYANSLGIKLDRRRSLERMREDFKKARK